MLKSKLSATFLGVSILFVSVGLLAPVFTQRALAATTYKFVSQTRIEETLDNGNKRLFVINTGISKGTIGYFDEDINARSCPDRIALAKNGTANYSNTGTLTVRSSGNRVGECNDEQPKNITVGGSAVTTPQPGDTSGSNAYTRSSFGWQDSGTITSTGSIAATWTLNGDKFVRSNDSDDCKDFIESVSGDKTTAVVIMQKPPDGARGGGCSNPVVEARVNITLGNVTAAELPPGEGAVTPFQECAKNMDGTGWLVCKMASGADNFVGWVDEQLYKLLRMNDVSTNADLQSGWRSFRNIASGLIILIVLIMVASQIFGFEFMSAYSIKKVLPRLFIAVIAIQLSWILGNALISFFNALGDGVEAILLAPFADELRATAGDSSILTILGKYAESFEIASGEMLLTNGALLGAAALGVIGVGGFWGLAFAAIGLVIVALVAFVTLVLRKIVIIVLLLVMPLALAAWILPNTEHLWKKWWSMFSKLLLMYPLVIALLTIGKAFAWMAATGAAGFQAGSISAAVGLKQFAADAGTDLTVLFIILIAYFGPYIFIPSMFKMAGGIFAKGIDMLGGNANKLKGVGPFKRVGEARDNYHKGRDYNRKHTNIERANSKNPFIRKYGQLQAGTAGGRGAFARQMRESEQQQALKNAEMEIASATKGQDYKSRMADLTTLASSKTGSSVDINGTSVKVTETMQRAAAKTLADNGEVDNMNLVRDGLLSQGSAGAARWNTISDENAGSILKADPMLLGKKVGDLNAEQLVTMKPQSLRRGRQALASASTADQQRAKDRANEALTNTETLSKLSESAKAELTKISSGDFTSYSTETITHKDPTTGAILASHTTVVDFAGRTQQVYDRNGTLQTNNDFGKSASAKAGQPGSPGAGPRMF